LIRKHEYELSLFFKYVSGLWISNRDTRRRCLNVDHDCVKRITKHETSFRDPLLKGIQASCRSVIVDSLAALCMYHRGTPAKKWRIPGWSTFRLRIKIKNLVFEKNQLQETRTGNFPGSLGCSGFWIQTTLAATVYGTISIGSNPPIGCNSLFMIHEYNRKGIDWAAHNN